MKIKEILKKRIRVSNKFVFYWIVLMLLFSIDSLFLTPSILSTQKGYELNPMHSLGFETFGLSYSLYAWLPIVIIVTTIMYVQETYAPKGARIIFPSYLILVSIAIINNTLILIQ